MNETTATSQLATSDVTMKVALPRIYLGTMSFGWSQTSSYVDQVVAQKLLDRFVQVMVKHNNVEEDDVASASPVVRIDTARIYAGGKTETICGAILKAPSISSSNDDRFQIHLGTKAHPSHPQGLSVAGIQAQLAASQAACHVQNFSEYYLHQPDPEHSLLESLIFLHQLVQQGNIRAIGMSNYHYLEMKRAFELCEQHQLTPPTVYQGIYNPLNRGVEQDLLPLLRQHDCSFVAYNPLAAGLLTGKHTDPNQVQKGRFHQNPNYLPRFYTSSNFQAVDKIREQCQADSIGMVDATFQWLLRHSALGPRDGVLLGASSLSQLDENLKACTSTQDLSAELMQVYDQAWEITKEQAFPYWRSFSADMPGRESLDPGAAYQAVKK